MRSALALMAITAIAPHARAQTPLEVHVQYPAVGATVTAADSTFIFGRVEGAGSGAVTLTVNDVAVDVHSAGGWLAFVAVAPDSFTFHIRAAVGERHAELDHTVWISPPPPAPGDPELGYRPQSIEPYGPIEIYPGDPVSVSVIAAPGQHVRARAGRVSVQLHPGPAGTGNRGRQVFGAADRVDRGVAGRGAWVRYAGEVPLSAFAPWADRIMLEFDAPGLRHRSVEGARLEYLDPSAVRVAIAHDDTAATGRTDGRVVARTGPGLGYQTLLPNDTPVVTGRLMNGYREIELAPGRSAWIRETELVPVRRSRPASTVAVIRTRVSGDWTEIVVPLADRVPIRVEQWLDPARFTLDLYGVRSDIDWIRRSVDLPDVREIRWRQPADGMTSIEIDLTTRQAWGYRMYWEGTHLVLAIRRPPAALASRRSGLAGLRIVIDPGHSPATGSVGPTGLEERDANLAVSLRLAEVLEARGAEVVLTRATADSTLGLYDRTNLAIAARGDLFLSIHANALPDGVNPFTNNGTSTYYYHPQSRPLAEAIQKELLPRTGLPDYGVTYGNLAVVRMNEMPAVLVESAFIMIPEQEALLRTERFQRAIAEGVADGIERFLDERNR